MSRLMSVTLTEHAVVTRTKTVTRRLGWRNLKPGDRLTLCRKVMGRKRKDGTVEPLVRLAEVEVVSVRREPLFAITDEEIEREGFRHIGDDAPEDFGGFEEWAEIRPGLWQPPVDEWCRWYLDEMGLYRNGAPQNEVMDTMVTRIEWRYLDGEGS